MNTAYPKLNLLIDGECITSRETRPVINPATGELIGDLPCATLADLDDALAAASRGFVVWRAVSPKERGRILKRAADLIRERLEVIATWCTLEEGKPILEARMETAAAADTLEWYAEEGRRAYGRIVPTPLGAGRLMVTREPVGPVAAFAPWNFPVVNPARKFGAALAAGCSCIMKPPEEAPASALAIAQALVDAGVPAGVVGVVFGDPASISEHLLASPIIRKISFTGSVAVGQHLIRLAAGDLKRTTMELGGHAPVIVFDDVDIDRVAELTVGGKFRNAGQVCVSPTRFYVHDAVFEQFAASFAARARSLRVGDGLDAASQMGPLANPRRFAAIQGLTADACQSGARLLAGGKRIGNRGNFWEPTVLADVPDSARIMHEEPFGPVALLNRFSTLDEAIALANGLPFGLAAYAFTNNATRLCDLGDRIEAGMVGLNSLAISLPEAPFGGVKHSGHGSENGIEGLEACLVTKLISQG